MHADRLLLLRDHLLEVHEEHAYFNMRNWFVTDNMPSTIADCGTASCALGHACMIPALKELGLYASVGTPMFADPITGRVSSAFRAGADIFGITEQASRFLFDDENYWPAGAPLSPASPTTAKDVATRIHGFVTDAQALARA